MRFRGQPRWYVNIRRRASREGNRMRSDMECAAFEDLDRHELDQISLIEHDFKRLDLLLCQRERFSPVVDADLACNSAMGNPRAWPVMFSAQRWVYQTMNGGMRVAQ